MSVRCQLPWSISCGCNNMREAASISSRVWRLKARDPVAPLSWPLVRACWLDRSVVGGFTWPEHVQEREVPWQERRQRLESGQTLV